MILKICWALFRRETSLRPDVSRPATTHFFTAIRNCTERIVTYMLKLVIATLLVTCCCFAQEGLTIRARNKQKVPAAEAEKIYLSACSVIQRKFGGNRVPRPQVTLIVGANAEGAYWDLREIRLIKWDPYLFAQGVVMFAFDDLMPTEERMAVAKRAVTWADSTVEVNSFAK